MLRQIIIFNAFSVILVASMVIVKPGPTFPPTKGEVWPKPQFQKKHDIYYKLKPSDFKFKVTGQTCNILTTAIERYTHVLQEIHHNLSSRHSRDGSQSTENANTTDFKCLIRELQIKIILPCEEYPQMNMDEIYNLNTSAVSILKSNTIWGALRGLETFVQLFYISDDFKSMYINITEIEDYPKYPHRGILIDTARHYISLSNIKKTLDAMEMNKMNVFHWHMVDDQSFPYQSERFPELSAQGAYAPSLVYTKANIIEVVNYARDRGIRVLPEIDVPGHTASWGVAYPNILTKCYLLPDRFIGYGPMDPTKNITYKLIGELFQELQEIFPEKYFHVGGDEVELICWSSNPEIVLFMIKNHISNPNQLHAYFMNKIIPLLGNTTKPIVWQEVFDEGVPLSKDSIIQVWKSTDYKTLVRILRAGHKLIYSSSWYLDHMQSGGDWVHFYRADPRDMIPSTYMDLNLENIVGGEACMWGEVVDDENLISRVWPRASAVAERLWSPDSLSYRRLFPEAKVFNRLEEHACRMKQRGVHAQPPSGPGFCITN